MQNWMGFRNNQLTRMLMGIDAWGTRGWVSLGVVVASGLLLIPSIGTALLSWLARAGALMQISAVKPNPSRAPSEMPGANLMTP